MTPDSLAAWNARQIAARAAYDADQRVAEGWCASCGIRRVNNVGRRQCKDCNREGRRGH